MHPVEPIGGGTAPSQIHGASSRQRYGHDGQRKRVAHMPTATTTKEDSRSKLVQNHPHDFTKKQKRIVKNRKSKLQRQKSPMSVGEVCTEPASRAIVIVPVVLKVERFRIFSVVCGLSHDQSPERPPGRAG
jgi:hypothetical protein